MISSFFKSISGVSGPRSYHRLLSSFGSATIPLLKDEISAYEIDLRPSSIKFFSEEQGKKSEYRVTFRSGDAHARKSFSEKVFIMPISIGQIVHENGRMLGTLQLINRSFKKGYILVDDVIQRHTKQIFHPKEDPEKLYQMCLDDGDEWIKRYEPFCKRVLSIDYTIIRWEKWLTHDKFPEFHDYVKQMRLSNAAYHEAFERNINEYIGRLFQKYPDTNYKMAYELCLKYLEEECAAMLLWPELGVDIEIYPSDRNHAMRATEELIIRSQYGKGLSHVGLRFQKKDLEGTSAENREAIIYEPRFNK